MIVTKWWAYDLIYQVTIVGEVRAGNKPSSTLDRQSFRLVENTKVGINPSAILGGEEGGN